MSMKRNLGGAVHSTALGTVGTGHTPTSTTSYWRPLALLVCAALAASVMTAVGLASPAQAADPLIVNSSTDSNDGACTTGPEGCTLREAIDAANAAAGQADTIEFDLGQSATITLATPLPTVTDSGELTIDARSADITISGGHSVRVFKVGSGAYLTLENLTVANGYSKDFGGGIVNEGHLAVYHCTLSGNYAYPDNFHFTDGYGGGIYNSGTAEVDHSTFSGNFADFGGVIDNVGNLHVTDSTFSDNSAIYGGGGIENEQGASTRVDSSTFSNNSADQGGGILNAGDLATGTQVFVNNSTFSGNSAYDGGGIFNFVGFLSVNNSTLSGNSASSGGGGGILNGSAARLQNTIVANSTSGENCYSYNENWPINDGGYNLDSGNTCGFSAANNSLINMDPKLGALADNGGPTKTHALLEGSPAIDKGYAPFFGETTFQRDQRGQTRPSDLLDIPNASGGDASDIGAFEAQAPTVAVAPGGSCATNDRSGTINLTVNDPDGTAESLTLSASSSKLALVPTSNVTFGGTGADRTLTATAASGKSGTAVLTVTVTDGQQIKGTPLTVKVRVGGNGNDTLAGDANSDILFGQNANDTLRGAAGKDLMCGGRGDDRLRGATEADFFGGGTGTDVALDFNAGEGDTKDSTIP